MLERLLRSKEEWAPVIIRLMLAVVIFPHGAQKLLGWFGGYGFTGTMGYFTETVGLPWIVGFLVILIEFFVPFLLAAGLFSRIAALSVFGLFTGIVLNSHIQLGFFMNWYGQLEAGLEGFEYHLLVLAMAGALMVAGGGKHALDRYVLNKYALEA
ncbi:MAG: DoxX family protein [Balneolaceae bacterium]|nr:DoxX family protein [Balneolaceae bacterium]